MSSSSEAGGIAVVGIACALPSGSYSSEDLDYDTLWDFLMKKGEAYEKLPGDRLNIEAWYGTNLGQINTTQGAFLKNATAFDHLEFGISLRDATSMSPSTRRLIELSFLALLDSGLDYRGKRVGCFMAGTNPGLVDKDQYDEQGSFGAVPAMIANRVSYTLDINGPSISLDTACSSSMSATHLAIQSILTGDCEAALVGGCQYNHTVQEWIQDSAAGVLSPDGKCKPFDAGGNGFSRAEGAAVIVLKPYEKAMRDGDRIYATILGSAINSTGGRAAPSVPVGQSQQECIILAYDRARRDPKEVDYLELHATGTAVGDPIEANAAGQLFCGPSELPVGSIKGNLGHLEITAFLASLIKVCLIFEHKAVPPQANLSKLNPAINWKEYGLKPALVPLTLVPRHGASSLLASISSFGIGGANGHAVLESPPMSHSWQVSSSDTCRGPHEPVLVMAGGLTQRSAIEVGNSIIALIETEDIDVKELSWTSIRRTRQLLWRTFAIYEADGHLSFPQPVAVPYASPPVVFVLSGQGPQHLDMGRQLYNCNAEFRRSIHEMDVIYRDTVGTSLIETTGLFERAPVTTALPDIWPIEITLPGLAMFQMALIDMLASVGVIPDVVVGHSAGETAVLYASKAGSKAMSLKLAIARGQAMSLLENERGTMAALACTPTDAVKLISELGVILDIACYNAPEAVTVSGAMDAVAKLLTLASERGIWARQLRTKVPVHSAMMVRCETLYRAAVQRVFDEYGEPYPSIETYSTLTGRKLEEPFCAEYFWKNARRPVMFTEAITALQTKYPNAVYMEISPHPVLSSYITAICGPGACVTCCARRSHRQEEASELHSFYNSLGHICLQGYNGIDLRTCIGRRENALKLPAYPFALRHVPFHAETSLFYSRLQHRAGPLNFPGLRVNYSTHPDLAEHVIQGEPIMPASGFLEMAFEFGALQLCEVVFHSTLSLSQKRPLEVAVSQSGARWTVHSRLPGLNLNETGAERLHASGLLSLDDVPHSRIDLPTVKARCSITDLRMLQEKLRTFAQFGPHFSRVQELYRGEGEVLAFARGYDNPNGLTPPYCIDPAMLDACLQSAYILLTPQDLAARYYLPAKVGYVSVQKAATRKEIPRIASYIKLVSWRPDSVVLDITVCDDTGMEICSLQSLVLEGHRRAPLQAAVKRFEVIRQPFTIPSTDLKIDERSSGEHHPSLHALYVALDQRAKDVILETLQANPRVGLELSRQRYFDFMKKSVAIGVQPPNFPVIEQALRERWPAHFELTERVASVHHRVLLSSNDIVDILFKDNFMDNFYSQQDDVTSMCKQLASIFREVLRRIIMCGKRTIRILEFGTGTGLLTSYLEGILGEFPGVTVEYVATDISFPLVSGTLSRLGFQQLRPQAYDISRDPSAQGLVRGTFDIVAGLNVLHVVPELSPCLQGLQALLVPGGSLLFVDFDGAKWGSAPGTLWHDFVFGCFKEWFSFMDLETRFHCTLALQGWRDLLLDHGFGSVSSCEDLDGGLFAVIHAQKGPRLLDMPSALNAADRASPLTIRYRVGQECEIRGQLQSFSLDDGDLLWLLASEGEDGDALLGFGRSLVKELPLWSIKLAIYSETATQCEHKVKALLPALSSHCETEFYIDECGEAHVSRIVIAKEPTSLERRPFDPHGPWMVQSGGVVHTSRPTLCSGQVLVSVEIWSASHLGLRAFSGKILEGYDSPFLANDDVVGLTAAQQTNFLAIDHFRLARIPGSKDNIGFLVSLVIPSAVAAVLNTLFRPSRRQPERTRRALILDKALYDDCLLRHVLSQARWAVSHRLAAEVMGPYPLPSECGFDIIVVNKEAKRLLPSFGLPTPYRIFTWNDEVNGLNAYIQHPNFGEDLEMMLQQIDCEPPQQMFQNRVDLPLAGTLVPYRGALFRPDRTYLLLGGIGGLGIPIAAWMYEKGARHIILTSRSGESSLIRLKSPHLQQVLAYLRSLPDLQIGLEACDSTCPGGMTSLCKRIQPTIAGCMVMPLVLSDKRFTSQTEHDFQSVYDSKVRSFQTLIKVVHVESLDFIIAFSSVSGLFGNGGQTNYAAGCTAMDALASKLRNAFTLIVPPITDVGYFSRQLEEENLSISRFAGFGITCEDLCVYIEDGILRLLDGPFTYQIPDLDWSAVENFTGQSLAFRHLVPPQGHRTRLDQERSEDLTISDIVCRELQIAKEDLSDDVPLTRYGFDSLSAARLSAALRPFGQITQLQLLGDITVDGIRHKLSKNDALPAVPVETMVHSDASTGPIVRLRDDGTMPLIILHGADGSIAPIRMLMEKFEGSLWAIQLTDKVPMTSLEEMSAYYFDHIKLLRPQGPYRLGTFSGSAAVGVHLCKQLESKGDRILQLAFVDFFPTITVGLNPDLSAALQADDGIQPRVVHRVLDLMSHMFARDGELNAVRSTLGEDLAKLIHGLPSSSLAEAYGSTVRSFVEVELRFIRKIGTGDGAAAEFERERYVRWLKDIRAPITVFWAREGITRDLPAAWMEDGETLDVKMVYPDAKVHWLPLGHSECLATAVAAELLQGGWQED